MSRPLDSIRRLPAVGVLAERQMGGFLALSALVGVGVGLGAAGLVLLLEAISQLLEPVLGAVFNPAEVGFWDLRRAWIFLTVPLGLFIAWWVAKRFAPEVAGDGVPEATAALAIHGGRMKKRVIPLKMFATAVTIGSGGSAGREGPIVQIGAAVGSWVSRRFHLGEDQVRALVAAGAGAGIGASFNAPIAGMLFALEVILSSFEARHMSAIVLASVTAAITTQLIVDPERALQAEVYTMNSFSELFLYAALAVVIVVVGFFFLRLLDTFEGIAHKRDRSWSWMRPVGAGLLVAGFIFVEPQLFGSGQEFTRTLLFSEQITAITGIVGDLWWVLILLALGKAVATSLTISSGASGGAFMPSLFMGAALGTGFARLVEPYWTLTDLQPGAFAVVGMAGMFAVVGRAPLTAILIVFEVTGAREYGLIVPLLLVATLGTFFAERFNRESVYTQALKRKGIRIRTTGSVDLLDTVVVGQVMSRIPPTTRPDANLQETEDRLNRHRSHGLPVIEDEKLIGIVTVSDISRASGTPETTPVSEVMTPRPATVTPTTPVSRALERMAVLGVGRLPVVDDDDPERLVGMFRREEAVRAYHEALTASTDSELHRMRLAQRTDPGAGYYDFRIPLGSIADGRRVREVSWPEGSTLVSIRRNRDVMVPTGDTLLLPGDVITAFGTETSKRRMIDRLNSGADEPTAEIDLEELAAAADEAMDEDLPESE
ncbi:MAG: chloride channel protein [Actinomycetota bacterium]|nr:chloride channel protein [Actinomycetota bacterium]